MKKVLVVDNYDSFVYNLVYLLKEIGCEVEVHRNDKITLEEVKKFDHILLSPGPGIPSEAGIMLDLLNEYKSSKRIFGVCLGHQAIAESFGASLSNMGEVLHGVTTECVVSDPNELLFQGIPSRFEVCRYHSWTVLPETMPSGLKVTALDDKGFVLAEAHEKYDVRGVQFHPEAYLTQHGLQMIKNWMK
ncbi:aminodeoxychorismate/anthranilate synthase component II [Sandaracinomonas limnophila]|uniref:Aminodeoxychorismate/anthranilate synthase component II n=1 Tax=Sandaracinomonas limnophila TaxID=1862386 RepID=A0A437PUG0_9BACT|nr:aminodeoxychorismate/anthranilate synthase component II [Sandaracinomonas limnophila]RVU25895.1 aminodeoxychorismate/anthranilate synthase component II [Sandaracinomonas limnophila]